MNKPWDYLIEGDTENSKKWRSLDPDGYFRQARRKLAHKHNLGQLRLGEWYYLIDGADHNNHSVWLATPRSRGQGGIYLMRLLNKVEDDQIHMTQSVVSRDEEGNFTNRGSLHKGHWEGDTKTRASLNNMITADSRLVLHPDTAFTYNKDSIVDELGIADMDALVSRRRP